MAVAKDIRRLPRDDYQKFTNRFALLIDALLFASYQYLFVAATLDDARQYEKDQNEQIQLHRSLFFQTNSNNMTRSYFSYILNEHCGKDYIVKEHDDHIEVGNIVILFKDEKLVNISSLSEYNLP